MVIVLQSLMKEPETAAEVLGQFTAQELEMRFNQLQGEYDRRFKR